MFNSAGVTHQLNDRFVQVFRVDVGELNAGRIA